MVSEYYEQTLSPQASRIRRQLSRNWYLPLCGLTAGSLPISITLVLFMFTSYLWIIAHNLRASNTDTLPNTGSFNKQPQVLNISKPMGKQNGQFKTFINCYAKCTKIHTWSIKLQSLPWTKRNTSTSIQAHEQKATHTTPNFSSKEQSFFKCHPRCK